MAISALESLRVPFKDAVGEANDSQVTAEAAKAEKEQEESGYREA